MISSWCLVISLFFLLILGSTQIRFIEGRTIQNQNSFSQTVLISEDKMFKRAQMGSRPPRCERKCSSCGHCEAIQVPTNPQFEIQSSRKRKSFPKVVSNVAYARGDGNSNYKPLSWKCKCGNFIFNP